jgi:hypothetical protein
MNDQNVTPSLDRFFTAPLAQTDPELAAILNQELVREQDGIELIASENIVSRAVMEASATTAAAARPTWRKIWQWHAPGSCLGAGSPMCSPIPVARRTRRCSWHF